MKDNEISSNDLPHKHPIVTLEDFEKRYRNIREQHPYIGQCNHEGCPNPPDITPGLGLDSSCAYHRLLFDFWLYERMDPVPEMENTLLRREAYGDWHVKLTDEDRDAIVLRAAQDPLDWYC